MLHIIWSIILGFIAGAIASVIMHTHLGFIVTTVVGIVGSIVGGVTAAAILRRLGEVRTVGIGLGLFGVCTLLLVVPSLPVVVVAFILAGIGIVWAIVAFNTALQTRTPLAIQGRVSAAVDVSLSVAQTTSIAVGAALSTVVDYRILLVTISAVVLGSTVYLATRREPPMPAEVFPLGAD